MSWYSSAWKKRKPIIITGSTVGAQTDYQVKVIVAYDSDMKSDFSDIRFVDSDDVLLEYYLYSKEDGVSAVFWVKIPSIPSSPSTITMYIYYNNLSVSSLSTEAIFTENSQEILTDKTEAAWGSSDPLYNTYYHDNRAEFVLLSEELRYGNKSPVKITGIKFKPSALPGRDLADVRIRAQSSILTDRLTGNFITSGYILLYGPTTISKTLLEINIWFTHTFTTPFYWDNITNLLFDISRDDSHYTSGGNMYTRSISGNARMASYYADSERTWPFDGAPVYRRTFVPSMTVDGLFRKYVSPEPSVGSLGAEETFEYTAALDFTMGGISSDFLLFAPSNISSLESTLEGMSSTITLFNETGFSRIKVCFDLCRSVFEDIPMIQDWCRVDYGNLPILFQINKFDTYNYENIRMFFQVNLGTSYQDIPIIFSVNRAAQSFASYIMQKLYCVTSEVGIVYEDCELLDWNVLPNKTWYVQVDGTAVTLYESQTDLEDGTNAIAVGIADSSLRVVLTYVDEYEGDMEFYYPDIDYHLSLSEESFGVRKFRVKPTTDLSEIRDPIYNNFNVVLSRGEAELALHTFSVLGRSLLLGTHLPELEVGDVANLTSVRRGVTDEKSQILSQTITGIVSEGGETSLVTSISVANYIELTR